MKYKRVQEKQIYKGVEDNDNENSKDGIVEENVDKKGVKDN